MVFHAAEADDRATLKVLLDAGADLDDTGTWGNTPVYFNLGHKEGSRLCAASDRGIAWLLAHGADPDVPCTTRKETALQYAARARGPKMVALLLKHGADVSMKRGDGRTAWLLATRAGRLDNARLLEKAGAKPEPLSPADELLAACGAGDAAAAQQLSAILPRLAPEDLQLLPHAASDGRLEAVAACLAAGFPVDTVGDFGGNALQWAALHGHAAVVRELLRHKPDLTRRDPTYDGDALGWALHGAAEVRRPGADYAGVVEALMAAGMRPRHGEFRTGDAGVDAVLKKYL